MAGRRELSFRQQVDMAELKDALKRERVTQEISAENLPYGEIIGYVCVLEMV